MSITATLSADIRSRANYLPPCPCCSHVGVHGFPDIIRGPSHRTFRTLHKLDPCCALSAGMSPMDSQADVAQWWRARRTETLMDLASDNRRRHCLEKLAAKELEPIA